MDIETAFPDLNNNVSLLKSQHHVFFHTLICIYVYAKSSVFYWW